MDRENALQALKDLLAELPAEFSYSVPGAHESRFSFRVTKKRNVRRVHQALWSLQCYFGLQAERGHNLDLLEPTVIDDDTKAISNVYARGQEDAEAGIRALLNIVESGKMTPEQFVHTLKGYLG